MTKPTLLNRKAGNIPTAESDDEAFTPREGVRDAEGREGMAHVRDEVAGRAPRVRHSPPHDRSGPRRWAWYITRGLTEAYAAAYFIYGGVFWGFGLAPPGSYGSSAIIAATIVICLLLAGVIAAVVKIAPLIGGILILVVVVAVVATLRRWATSYRHKTQR